jgi:hypothetical protein
MKRFIIISLIFFLSVRSGFSWIYPEHRDIMVLSIQKLDPGRRIVFEQYWTKMRTGHESRLSVWPADTTLSKGSGYIDYASFPAIAGDHSVSANDMTEIILKSGWILKVSDIALELKVGLAKSKNRSERLNKLRDSDLQLLKADPQYVTRAGANNVHFMLARPEVSTTMLEYLTACIKVGCEPNAPGAYWWYHLSALQKAGLYAADTSSAIAGDLLLSAFADEAFAIHFLEDMFASGHVAGCWGNAAQRKGTHDYYDEKGIEVSAWDGKRMVLMGDAFMRPQDADLTAQTVVKSLVQVIDAATGKHVFLVRRAVQPVAAVSDTFNVCKAMSMPVRERETQANPLFLDVLGSTVMPGLAKGAGELPRFRSELGAFIGLSAAVRGSVDFTGFGKNQNTAGYISGLDMSLRLGLGLEGVLNEAGDGMVFLDLGYRLDGASSMKISTEPELQQYGNIVSTIPYRNALYGRLRMPFYIIPGDLLVVAPILYIFAPGAASKMIATAGNGGLIPWQTGLLSSIGRFQFVLGREVGFYFFGYNKTHDQFIGTYESNGTQKQVVVNMKSTQLEFPVVEYRPFHMFSSNQTAAMMIQLYAGVDIPGKPTVVAPAGAPAPTVRSIPILGLRVVFDWRYYLGSKF